MTIPGDNDPNKKTDDIVPPANQIKKEDFDRVNTDYANTKKAFDATAKELTDLKAKLAEQERKQKETGGDFKSLYEAEKTAKSEIETRFSKLKEGMIISEKHKAASAALVKAGILPDAMKLLDFQDFQAMQAEVTSAGRTIVHGADQFAEQFKKDYPYAFSQGKPPIQNNGGGKFQTADGNVTITELMAVEKKFGNTSEEYYQAFDKYLKGKQVSKQ